MLSHDLHPALKEVLKPAEMDKFNHTTCLENTRLNIIEDVMEWIADDSEDRKQVLWVYSLARTGKSTLLTTITQNLHELECLGAFFFFNCDKPQRNFAALIKMLTYQFAMFDTRFSAAILRVAEVNDNIAGMLLAIQFEKLLSANALESMEWSGGPIVFIIDALDECGSEADCKGLMQVVF
jgi:hypothetical protein